MPFGEVRGGTERSSGSTRVPCGHVSTRDGEAQG
jgi:hypothetical protein